MDYKVCKECGTTYYYFDSPAMEKCFCGGEMREPTKEEETDILSGLNTPNYATVSC